MSLGWIGIFTDTEKNWSSVLIIKAFYNVAWSTSQRYNDDKYRHQWGILHFADFDQVMGQKKLHIPNYLLTGRFGNKEKQNAREKRSLITMVIVLITTMMMKKSPLQTGRKRSPQSWSAKPRQTPWSRSSRGCSHCSAPRGSPPGLLSYILNCLYFDKKSNKK